jgi:hypothetical protein
MDKIEKETAKKNNGNLSLSPLKFEEATRLIVTVKSPHVTIRTDKNENIREITNDAENNTKIQL